MQHRTIVVVGCGFLGSHLTSQLAKLLFSQDLNAAYDLRLIDFDTWDRRNAANQNVSLSDAEQSLPKVKTLSEEVRKYHIACEPIQEKLTLENAGELLKGSALVIDCVDNVPTRQLLWALGKAGTFPVIHAGISKNGQGQINWSSKVLDTFPYRPDAIVGRELKNDDEVKEPPCEMFKYMYSGLRTVEACIKSIAWFLGVDPWQSTALLFRTALEPSTPDKKELDELVGKAVEQFSSSFTAKGLMTCWTTNTNLLELRADESVIVDGFFPVYRKD